MHSLRLVSLLVALVLLCAHGSNAAADPARLPIDGDLVTDTTVTVPSAVAVSAPNVKSAAAAAAAPVIDLGNLASQLALQNTLSNLLNLARQGHNYIISLKPGVNSDDFEAHFSALQDRLSNDTTLGQLFHKFKFGKTTLFHGYAGTFHPVIIQWIRALPFVHAVERDETVSFAASNVLTQDTTPNWGLNRIWQHSGARASGYQYNAVAGQNVDVYVLDTGILAAHTEFGGRATAGPAFVSEPAVDMNGHGSHVAGIISGATYGVAKKVNIIAVKVLGANGSGPWSAILAGLNWAVTNQQQTGRRSVINISISGGVSQTVNNAFTAAVAAGIPVFAAAGNSNQDACSYSPASANSVIAVGSINQQDYRSSFSNWGLCVNINAPGEYITSVGISSNTATQTMTGTSMASPHVAGIAAMVLSQHQLTPAQLLAYLQLSATSNAMKGVYGNTTLSIAYSQPADITTSSLLDTKHLDPVNEVEDGGANTSAQQLHIDEYGRVVSSTVKSAFVDRVKRCPAVLKCLVRVNSHVRDDLLPRREFGKDASDVVICTWPDATLRELANHVVARQQQQQQQQQARFTSGTRLVFRLYFEDAHHAGRYTHEPLGTVDVDRPGKDDLVQLSATRVKFDSRQYVGVGVFTDGGAGGARRAGRAYGGIVGAAAKAAAVTAMDVDEPTTPPQVIGIVGASSRQTGHDGRRASVHETLQEQVQEHNPEPVEPAAQVQESEGVDEAQQPAEEAGDTPAAAELARQRARTASSSTSSLGTGIHSRIGKRVVEPAAASESRERDRPGRRGSRQ
ncbi:hypothetical protein RI367_007951 [Sorochytrium milnesiophthora]